LDPRLGLTLIAVLLVCALVLAYRNRQAEVASLNFWFTLTTLLAITSVTLLPGQAVYDHVILLPGILMLVKYRRQFAEGGPVVRALQRIGVIIFLWPSVAAFWLIAVLRWLIDRPAVSGIFNVGTGRARSFRDLVSAMFGALGSAPNIEYIDMPQAIRDRYQYFTQSAVENLRRAGYNAAFTPLEEAVGRYVTQFLDRADRYR